ncbi:MAG: CinA family protein [Thiohalospira sp.]
MSAPDDAALAGLAKRLGERLAAAGWRVTAAESCTGGWIAKAVTDIPGSSGWFDTALVTYANAAKERLLGVPPADLETFGAVSEPVVRAMAAGVRDWAGADLACATSGIAGPGGGTPEKPVGRVWLAWAGPAGVAAACYDFAGDREAVRRQTVAVALEGLLERVPA